MTRESAIGRAERYFDAGTFRDDLARRVAFRTESQVPESRPQLGIYLEREIAPTFQRMGYATEILPNPVAHGGPSPTTTALRSLAGSSASCASTSCRRSSTFCAAI